MNSPPAVVTADAHVSVSVRLCCSAVPIYTLNILDGWIELKEIT